MNRNFKIILSIFFIGIVAFFVAKGSWNVEIKISPKKTPVKISAKKKVAADVEATRRVASTIPVSQVKPARMAIILDDWGLNLPLVKEVEGIGRPITLSVLPHLAHSREIAEEASSHGLGVMLHMPMQAKNLRTAGEPRTILTTSPDKQILEYLDQALESVPGAQGMNNHQGSAATSDERVMRTVLGHLKEKGLFFVDSQVISSTRGWRIAKEIGMPFTKRDVFIDNQPTSEAIKAQLLVAQKIALSRGRVVVIGHDKKVTIEAIREMVPELEKNGVKLVLVKELLE